MKRKTLRILIIALCVVVIAAEAILVAVVFKKKDSDSAKEEKTERLYKVKRVVEWTNTNPDTTATYTYDEHGRITEIIKNGRFRETFPGSDSDLGVRTEQFFYDESGKLVKAMYKENESEWEDDEQKCANKILRIDKHGGVYYYPSSVPGTAIQFSIENTEMKVIDMSNENPERYDEDGRLIEKEYTFGVASGRHSYFSYDGNIVRREDFDKNGELMRTCRFEYDDWGRLVLAQTSKAGSMTEAYKYTYDSKDNLICEEYWGTRVQSYYTTRYSYDAKGFLLEYTKEERDRGIIVKETRKYEEFLVREEDLTNEERKRFGLPYDQNMIEEKKLIIDMVSWNITDDWVIMY